MSDKIIVHHLNDSRSQKVLWLLEELGVPYEIHKYQRQPDMHAPKELFAIHPLGKIPAITDGDVVVAESGAIIEYLINKYGKDQDKPSQDGWLDNLYYTHYAEGTLMPLLVNKLIFSIAPTRTPFFIRPLFWMIFGQLDRHLIVPELKKNLEMIDKHLKKTSSGWFAGGEHPTSADYMMSFPLEALVSHGAHEAREAVREYVKRVHERPAYKRALEKGGEYAYAKL